MFLAAGYLGLFFQMLNVAVLQAVLSPELWRGGRGLLLKTQDTDGRVWRWVVLGNSEPADSCVGELTAHTFLAMCVSLAIEEPDENV